MKKLCVFCGSSGGSDPKYIQLARDFGEQLAQRNIGLVYGGASIGVMGAVADSTLLKGGKVWGVIPKSLLDWEVGHSQLTDLQVVDTMHARKEQMYKLSNGFVAIPGGMGTLDELCEIVTWAQLKYHTKPCYVLNFDGFYDHLIQHFQKIHHEGFLSKQHLELVQVYTSLEQLLDHFEAQA